jgi:hypothetical protein
MHFVYMLNTFLDNVEHIVSCPPNDDSFNILNQLLSAASEEDLDNGHLADRNTDHENNLKNREPVDSRLGALHSGLVSGLSDLEVSHLRQNGVDLGGDLVKGVFDGGMLGSLLVDVRGQLGSQLLMLELDLEVHSLLVKGRHVVVEAELVLSSLIRGHDVLVHLSSLVVRNLAGGGLNTGSNVEATSLLDGVVEENLLAGTLDLCVEALELLGLDLDLEGGGGDHGGENGAQNQLHKFHDAVELCGV